MKATLACILVLAWTSAAWTSEARAQAASHDALTNISAARRGDGLRSLILSAEQAVTREEWAAALLAWQALAKRGADSAPVQLCRLYFDARQGSFEETKATDWCRRAGGAGDADGLYRMGMLYLFGLGVPKNIEQAQAFCAAALDRDARVPAKFCLAVIAQERAHAAKSTLADVRNRRPGSPPANNMAATPGASPRDMCDSAFAAIGDTFNAIAVTKWCGDAAQGGDPSALHRMGLMRLAGLGGAKDLDSAERDCASANERGQGHLSAAFCLAAVAKERRSMDTAAQVGDLAGNLSTNRPLPTTLPDPFATDQILDKRHRTITGLDYTCRKLADWARFEAPGLVILKPADKLVGKAILDYRRQDFDELDRAARDCADAVAASGSDEGLRLDFDNFRASLTALKTRQASLQGERQQARAEADKLAREEQTLTQTFSARWRPLSGSKITPSAQTSATP